MPNRYRIQFPPGNARELSQDEVYFYLLEGDEKQRIRLHDYDKLYARPGLYEQVVYERLRCQSPTKVLQVLKSSVAQARDSISELRVLDLGAGNGVMGEELKKVGVSRIVGVDIVPEAYEATERDRPGVYDGYYVVDFTDLRRSEREELESWSLDCLTAVAALGFGDIPTKAFMQAFNMIDEHGWVAFNIKESFLDRRDETGFSRLIRELIFSDFLELYYLERYRHRYSMEGVPLYYFALGGRKNSDVPRPMLESFGIDVGAGPSAPA